MTGSTHSVDSVTQARWRMSDDDAPSLTSKRPAMRERLDQLLGSAEGEADRSVTEDVLGRAPAALLKLRGNPGRPSLASMQEELAKLDLIRRMDLPADLFDHASPRDLERCRRRVAVEAPHELRRQGKGFGVY